MSYLDYSVTQVPTGWRKLFHISWPLVLLVSAVCCVGFLMLYSVSGGRIEVWAEPQMYRFAVGLVLMIGLGLVPMWFWRGISVAAFVVCFLMLIAVDVVGVIGMGARRWIDI
ncbi:MAG: FtsW/RodA/SpoVE family cell cycle protein, partial [Paracoccus sp. (in: a-proteobacteria)]|nr:FtsW/RodA/SpoVE family cell cycle protein [Paracoccus sp. (in: a-proteobacteria)]